MYGMETMALTKRQDADMELAELKMLRLSLGMTRMNEFGNEYSISDGQRRRDGLERRGMKVNRRKTEYMCVNERQVNGTVEMQGEEVAKVEDFN